MSDLPEPYDVYKSGETWKRRGDIPEPWKKKKKLPKLPPAGPPRG